MLRLVLHLALRQAEGLAAGALRLLGQDDLRVPDHATSCRRGRGSAGRGPGAVRVKLVAALIS